MAPSDQRTHYDVLGIARDADAAAVRSAWKLHVQAWHPDRFSDDLRVEAERQTTRINEAYSTLRDSSRRAAYDCRLAADEAAARPAPTRRAKPTPSVPHRAPSAPVGSPMATAPQPTTLGEQLAAAGGDTLRMIRRHPRVFIAAASVWLVVFGGSVVLHAASGPTLPRSVAAPTTSSVVADDEQVQDLEELAERAREEAAEADEELRRLMAEDERRAAAEAAAAEREARAAAAAAAAAAKARARPRTKAAARSAATAPRTTPDGRRIVTILPSA